PREAAVQHHADGALLLAESRRDLAAREADEVRERDDLTLLVGQRIEGLLDARHLVAQADALGRRGEAPVRVDQLLDVLDRRLAPRIPSLRAMEARAVRDLPLRGRE